MNDDTIAALGGILGASGDFIKKEHDGKIRATEEEEDQRIISFDASRISQCNMNNLDTSNANMDIMVD